MSQETRSRLSKNKTKRWSGRLLIENYLKLNTDAEDTGDSVACVLNRILKSHYSLRSDTVATPHIDKKRIH